MNNFDNLYFLFSYGSNTLNQLGERIGRSISLDMARSAYIEGYARAYRGYSKGWDAAPATIIKLKDFTVYGNITLLSMDELKDLDRFEGVNSGNYKRVKKKVCYINEDDEIIEVSAYVYISTSKVKGIPSDKYLKAVAKNINTFWDADVTLDFLKKRIR